MNTNKQSMLGSYLQQQSAMVSSTTRSSPGSDGESITGGNGHRELIITSNVEETSLEQFREYVKKYIELDNWMKKAQDVIKEKKKQKAILSEMITKFMSRYDIEDLNVRGAGKVVYKTRQVKAPVSQKVIKEKITDYFKDENMEDKGKQIIKKVFEDRQVIEKASLRRIKIT